MPKSSETTSVSVKLIRETDKATLLAFEDEDWDEFWVPKSVIVESFYDEEGGEAEIRDWWLKTKDLL
jgi:hypothetical protein